MNFMIFTCHDSKYRKIPQLNQFIKNDKEWKIFKPLKKSLTVTYNLSY